MRGIGCYFLIWIGVVLAGTPLELRAARTVVIGTYGVPPEELFGRFIFRTMVKIYLRRYFRYSPYSRADLDRWLLPVAAGRLSEQIPHETAPLHAFVQARLKQLG